MFISVDLGSTRIMMMAAERLDDGRLKVLALETAETPVDSIQNGIIKKPDALASLISAMVTQMENRLEILLGSKYRITKFYTAINGRSLRSVRGNVNRTFAASTEVTATELALLHKDLRDKFTSDKALYSITNEEYIIDGEYVRDPHGIVCSEISANYLIVVGRNDIRNNLQKCIDRIKLSDVDIDGLAPIAMADAVLSDDDKHFGVAHINFGSATTTVTVYHDNYLRHVAVVPFGGKHITSDLANEACELNISLKEAEMLKVQKGTPIIEKGKNDTCFKLPSAPGLEPRKIMKRTLVEIINARLTEIVLLCMKEIECSGFADQLRAGLVITGGATRMADFKPFIEQTTNMSVRMGSFAHLIDDKSAEKYSDTEYTLLIGLLQNATDECTLDPNAKKEVEVEETPIEPKNTKKTGRGWGSFFKMPELSLFDDPDEPTIK